MNNSTKSIENLGHIDAMDRSFRAIIGFTILCFALETTIQTGVAYSFTYLVTAIIVLTAIVGWDPFVACYRSLRKLFYGHRPVERANTMIHQ